jgi:LysM repeat protein
MKQCKLISTLALLMVLSVQDIKAQGSSTEAIINYIKTYADLAIREMQRTGVPASIKIAQGILETGAGKSDLVQRSNNHFGIKCKSNWNGEKVYHNDDEEGECFRKYGSAENSYRDHSDYLASQPRYATLFDNDADDYNAWAWGLKKAGYATNPVYAQTLIRYIETYSLNELNKIARKGASNSLNEFYTRLESQTTNPLLAQTSLLKEQENEASPVLQSTLSANNKEKKHSKQRHRKIRFRSTYTVKKGDSLTSIAKKHNVSITEIKSANGLKKDNLQIGQLIKIPKKTT